jgi:hypothetical protein
MGTLFLAIVVIYERRDDANGVPAEAYKLAAKETCPLPAPPDALTGSGGERKQGLFDRAVRGYSDTLMMTPVRVLVVLLFAGYVTIPSD